MYGHADAFSLFLGIVVETIKVLTFKDDQMLRVILQDISISVKKPF